MKERRTVLDGHIPQIASAAQERKTLLITELQKLQDQPAPEKEKAEATGAAGQGAAAAKGTPIAEQAKDASVDEQHV